MTLSAQIGGGNMSENIRNGFVSWIHSKGYGFAECDDDEIEDSFIPPNLIEKHGLSANDEIRYIVGKSRGKDAVLEILSINNSVVITKKKISSDSPKKIKGTIARIAKSGNGVVDIHDYSDSVLCGKKSVKKHSLSSGDVIEFSYRNLDTNPHFDYVVEKIFSINDELIREKVPSKIVKAVKKLFFKPQKKLTKLFL